MQGYVPHSDLLERSDEVAPALALDKVASTCAACEPVGAGKHLLVDLTDERVARLDDSAMQAVVAEQHEPLGLIGTRLIDGRQATVDLASLCRVNVLDQLQPDVRQHPDGCARRCLGLNDGHRVHPCASRL